MGVALSVESSSDGGAVAGDPRDGQALDTEISDELRANMHDAIHDAEP